MLDDLDISRGVTGFLVALCVVVTLILIILLWATTVRSMKQELSELHKHQGVPALDVKATADYLAEQQKIRDAEPAKAERLRRRLRSRLRDGNPNPALGQMPGGVSSPAYQVPSRNVVYDGTSMTQAAPNEPSRNRFRRGRMARGRALSGRGDGPRHDSYPDAELRAHQTRAAGEGQVDLAGAGPAGAAAAAAAAAETERRGIEAGGGAGRFRSRQQAGGTRETDLEKLLRV